jgi:hypothetical protein
MDDPKCKKSIYIYFDKKLQSIKRSRRKSIKRSRRKSIKRSRRKSIRRSRNDYYAGMNRQERAALRRNQVIRIARLERERLERERLERERLERERLEREIPERLIVANGRLQDPVVFPVDLPNWFRVLNLDPAGCR